MSSSSSSEARCTERALAATPGASTDTFTALEVANAGAAASAAGASPSRESKGGMAAASAVCSAGVPAGGSPANPTPSQPAARVCCPMEMCCPRRQRCHSSRAVQPPPHPAGGADVAISRVGAASASHVGLTPGCAQPRKVAPAAAQSQPRHHHQRFAKVSQPLP